MYMTSHTILNDLLKKHTASKIANYLNVAQGTVIRWIEQKKTPKSYEMDLLRMLGTDIHYDKYTFSEKDQFFTPPETAQWCWDTFRDTIKKYGDDPDEYNYIEPSAGNGAFLQLLPQKKRIGFDIEPRHKEVINQDFLTWEPSVQEGQKYVVIGNPPFGLRGNLALRFINACQTYADYVCFILPQLFESDGKGSTRNRVQMNLIYNSKLQNSIFYDPEGRKVKVECIFQIWSRYHKNTLYEKFRSSIEDTVVKIYSLSDGGTPSSTRNKSKLTSCDVYLPSTCYGKEYMKAYQTFEELPNRRGYGIQFLIPNKGSFVEQCMRHDWSQNAFLSTNSALNLRKSSILKYIENLH